MARDYDEEIDWDNWSPDGEEVKKDDVTPLVVKDCNGHILNNGDTVAATKDIKVKGASDIKRGDKFKNIKLTDDVDLIESGKMVLRTEFFKKI